MYPNWRRGMKVGVIAGTIAALLMFGLSYLMSQQPAITPGSAALAFRPWWRLSNWIDSAGAFVVTTGIFGLCAAFRPDFGKK